MLIASGISVATEFSKAHMSLLSENLYFFTSSVYLISPSPPVGRAGSSAGRSAVPWATSPTAGPPRRAQTRPPAIASKSLVCCVPRSVSLTW